MSSANIQSKDSKIKYSELLSSLLSSISILTYSALSLLNSLSLDLYSMICMLKVVIPACACFWIIGYVVGTILDNYSTKITTKKKADETKAYEIPSIFSDGNLAASDNDMDGIL